MLILWPQRNQYIKSLYRKIKININFIFKKNSDLSFFIYTKEKFCEDFMPRIIKNQFSWPNIRVDSTSLLNHFSMTFAKYLKIWPLSFSPNSTKNPDNKWRLYFVTRIDRKLNHSKTLTNQEGKKSIKRH